MKDLKSILERLNVVKELIQERATCPTTDDSDISSEIDNDVKRWLPRFRISEAWGNPSSMDRQAIQKFVDKLPMMDGSDWKAKINGLTNFIANCKEACKQGASSSEALSGLVFTESMHAIVFDYNEQTAGFMFEGLLASLFGFESRAITTSGGGYTPITDVEIVKRVNDKEQVIELISAKLLNDGTGASAKGSARNMFKDLLDRNEDGGARAMKFIVALKPETTDGSFRVDFYEFTVGLKDEASLKPYVIDQVAGGGEKPKFAKVVRKEKTSKGGDGNLRKKSQINSRYKQWHDYIAQYLSRQKGEAWPSGTSQAAASTKKQFFDANVSDIRKKARNIEVLYKVKSDDNLQGTGLSVGDFLDESERNAILGVLSDDQLIATPEYQKAARLHQAHKNVVDYDFTGYDKGYKQAEIKIRPPVATLVLPSREKLREDGGGFLQALESNLVPIYKELAKLTHNLDTYFLLGTEDPEQGDGTNCRFTAAREAQGNLTQMSDLVFRSMTDEIQGLKEESDPAEITKTQIETMISEELEIVLDEDSN